MMPQDNEETTMATDPRLCCKFHRDRPAKYLAPQHVGGDEGIPAMWVPVCEDHIANWYDLFPGDERLPIFALDPSATQAIVVGNTYTFYSTLQGIDGNGIYPCLYTGQRCRVLAAVPASENETDEAQWRVQFADGAITGVWEGEINGYFLTTGQFHGPFACEVRPTDTPADFETNNQHPEARA